MKRFLFVLGMSPEGLIQVSILSMELPEKAKSKDGIKIFIPPLFSGEIEPSKVEGAMKKISRDFPDIGKTNDFNYVVGKIYQGEVFTDSEAHVPDEAVRTIIRVFRFSNESRRGEKVLENIVSIHPGEVSGPPTFEETLPVAEEVTAGS